MIIVSDPGDEMEYIVEYRGLWDFVRAKFPFANKPRPVKGGFSYADFDFIEDAINKVKKYGI